MAVEPADEGPGAVDALELFAGDAEPLVARAADRDDDGVVSGLELVVYARRPAAFTDEARRFSSACRINRPSISV